MPCTAQSSAGGAAMRVADAPRGTSGKHVERGGPPCARWAEAVVAMGGKYQVLQLHSNSLLKQVLVRAYVESFHVIILFGECATKEMAMQGR